MIFIFLTLITSLICVCFAYLYKKTKYFEERGIEYEKPELLFGNVRKVYMGNEHMIDFTTRLYNNHQNQRYVGAFNFITPMVFIKDTEIIKNITIKDFDHFVDHISFTDEEADPLSGKALLSLKGERWKEMRATLSPAFTSSKMRAMMPLMEECSNNFINFIKEKLKERSIQCIELEMKDLFSRYSNDVIASCGFGIEINSFKDKNNDFYKMAKKITTVGLAEFIKITIYYLSPTIARLFNLQFSPKDASDFMRNLVKNNMKERETMNIERPDMIHLLMLAKHGKLHGNQSTEDKINESEQLREDNKIKIEWSDDELTAQVMLFLFAGFETSSTLLGFMCYELAINEEIQKKLTEEIDDVFKNNDGKLSYANLNAMKYLDMVTMETLRLWPPVPSNDRLCVKPYKLPPQNDSSNATYEIKRGDAVWIPTFTIHRDRELYHDPEKFIPERFSEENKSKITPMTHLPFGAGPRTCIGSRFALMEAKLLIVNLLKDFELFQIDKTPVPMTLQNHFFNMIPTKGFWIGIKPRNR